VYDGYFMTKENERRTHERVALEIPIELVAIPVSISDGAHSSITKDISFSGLNCKINQYIPPFTQVEVKLLFPKKNTTQSPHQLSIQGTIVRIEPAEEKEGCSEYHIAIFVPSGINLKDKQFSFTLNDNQPAQYSD
jgi:hypothetical protein